MQRDKLIDIAKGFGILLVVFAHTYKGDISSVIYYFHMPMFFILTGCALTYSKSTTIKWKRLCSSIILPYIVFSLITFAYWTFVESRFRPMHDNEVIPGLGGIISYKWQQFINILTAIDSKDAFIYNIVLWYLPCLFVCRILYILLNKTKYPIMYSIVLGCIGILLSSFYRCFLPWCIELSLVSQPFILFGNRLYELYKKYSSMKFQAISFWGGGFTYCS